MCPEIQEKYRYFSPEGNKERLEGVISSTCDVGYENNWLATDDSVATTTRRAAGLGCEAEARAGRRVNDALREWSEEARGRSLRQ